MTRAKPKPSDPSALGGPDSTRSLSPISSSLALWIVTKRELLSYAFHPFSYLLAVSYLVLFGALGIYGGGFFDRSQADMVPFFTFQPYLLLLLTAALTMRLWAEERQSRSFELILTYPCPLWVWVIGKNLAASLFFFVLLLGTLPLWVSVSYLGDPDHQLILSGYLGSFLMSMALISLGGCCSALVRSQSGAFILTLLLGALFLSARNNVIQDALSYLPQWFSNALLETSVLRHFTPFVQGFVSLDDLLYFPLFCVTFIVLNLIVVELKKAA